MQVDRVGQQFGNYRLVRVLGRGGFSEVYLGEHVYLKTQAAIKLLLMHLSPDEFKDFLQEAYTLAHLEHPHILRLLDFGLEGGTPFLVMQYAAQGSLRQQYPLGTRLPLATIVPHVKEIAAALAYAHEQQIVHCDVKPENILLGRHSELLLSDFGVARAIEHGQHGGHTHATPQIQGTLAYIAPEQVRGETCAASDQYALAILVYEWLCGTHPFHGSAEEVVQQHLQATPQSLCERLPTLVSAVNSVVLTALAKDPAQRFSTIQEFAHALEQAYIMGERYDHGLITFPSASKTDEPLSTVAVETATQVSVWHVPYHRNPFFTGRQALLQTLAYRLQESPFSPCAITGLGGIGKTQVAVEYAYRHRTTYHTTFWIRADSYESVLSDVISIARILKLPLAEGQEPQAIVALVKQWLASTTNWLLIFDNAEVPDVVNDFLPALYRGHVLLTTRIQAIRSFATCIELDKMEVDEGALFLLRRSGRIAPDAPLEAAQAADDIEAKDIAKLMDGLPLALDQAGAYLEETACNLYEYIDLYRKQRKTLLDLRGRYGSTHPESVATTWLLAFERIERTNPAAIELLRLCAFLHAEDIPEDMIREGTVEPGTLLHTVVSDAYRLAVAVAILRSFSLLRRNADTKMLSINRLVQTVVKDALDEETQRLWAERTVRVVNGAFPDTENSVDWERCHSYMPHVLACVALIAEYQLCFPEAARLLNQSGLYMQERARYSQSAFLLKKALELRTQLYGTDSLEVAESMNNVGGDYLCQGLYEQAISLFQTALALRERLQTPGHPEIAVSLNNLALLYLQQGQYGQAEPLFLRALQLWEQLAQAEFVDNLARTLNNLALLYHKQQQFRQAEPLYRRALTLWEHIRGPVHPDVATCLYNLAVLLHQHGEDARAESLFQRVIAIREQTLGQDHPGIAHSLTYLAKVCQKQWKYAEAELLFTQALTIRRRALGPGHPDVLYSLFDMARFYGASSNYVQAEKLFHQLLSLQEQTLGVRHPDSIHMRKCYAVLLATMHRRDEAVILLRQANTLAKHRQDNIIS